jgi:hypothetical protein
LLHAALLDTVGFKKVYPEVYQKVYCTFGCITTPGEERPGPAFRL